MPPTCPMFWGPALPKGAMPCPSAHCECQAEVPPGACQAAPVTLCSLQALLAPWLGRGLEHEADAPVVSISGAFPCPDGVPSPACAKTPSGSPTESLDPLAHGSDMVTAARAGIYCQGNQDELLSCDFDIVVN